MDEQERFESRSGIISSIEPQLHDPARVNVVIDGRFALGISAERAAELDLRPGRRVSGEELDRLLNEDRMARALQMAVRFVSQTPRTESEVRRRLAGAGIDPTVQAEILDRLVSMRLLDDRRYLHAYLESRIRNQGYGPRRVREELVRRGLERDTIDRAMAAFLEETPALQVAEEQARRKWKKISGPGDPRRHQRKLFDFLIRRGFSSDTAREALRRIADGDRDFD